MIDVKPMLRATAVLSGLGLAAVSLTGHGSIAFTLAVLGSLANLVVLAGLSHVYVRAVGRGESAAAGLAVLHGKTLILLCSMALLGSQVGFAPVALGFVFVTTCFTVAAPAVALLHTTPQQTVEAL